MEELYKKYVECGFKVSTDTRKEIKNSLFFALSGENFDGNTFSKEAKEKGAKYVVVDNEKYATIQGAILVENTEKTLQELAKLHKNKIKTKVIGITGSNGKTTTKELIYAVLKQKYNTIATKGNLNNHIGVPLTILSITPQTEFAVVEMGANHPKEIEFLCQICKPDYAYITSFGKAHLEGFVNFQGVVKTKTELYQSVIDGNGTIFINKDNEIQVEKVGKYEKVYSFAFENNADLKLSLEEVFPYLTMEALGEKIFTQMVGQYNKDNIAASVVIGHYFKVETEKIKKAIEQYVPSNSRSQIIEKKNGTKILLDAYNANPTSMKAALDNFVEIKYPKKIAVLGEMKELGEESQREHKEIVEVLKKAKFDDVVLVGGMFDRVKENFKCFQTAEKAKEYLNKCDLKDTILLVKGSRAMTMEKAVEEI